MAEVSREDDELIKDPMRQDSEDSDSEGSDSDECHECQPLGSPTWTQWLQPKKEKGRLDSIGLLFVKWAVPGFVFMASTFTCMWLLHIGTFYYILTVDHFLESYVPRPGTNISATPLSAILSPGAMPDDISFMSLQDPIEGILGWTDVDMHMLDMVSALFPATWFFLTLGTRDLQAWTKMIICNAFLAVGKGVFACVTVVPDSIGWHHCQERLGPDNLSVFRNDITRPQPGKFPWATLSDIFVLELKSLWPFDSQKSVRFCADMLYSGHTYFTCLYALGLLEYVRMLSKRGPFKKSALLRNLLLYGTFAALFGEQMTEVVLVLKNRFHYTMDVAMAILLTLLFYTSAPISIFAKLWVNWPGPFRRRYNEEIPEIGQEPGFLGAVGRCTCHICPSEWYSDNQKREGLHHFWRQIEKESPPPGTTLEGIKEWARDANVTLVPREMLRTDGDIWIPICCVPFCCMWGRHHIVDDDLVNLLGFTPKDTGVYEPDTFGIVGPPVRRRRGGQ